MEPQNQALLDKINEVQRLRANGLPTVPTTLKDELRYNPFLRIDQETIRSKLGLNADTAKEVVMSKLRQAKDEA